MTRTIACPENVDLLAFAAGDQASPVVRSHVDACPRCLRAVRRLKAEIGCLRSSLSSEPLALPSRPGFRPAASGG
jgi:anti-sigma factor ChrR (cupin superfamily)